MSAPKGTRFTPFERFVIGLAYGAALTIMLGIVALTGAVNALFGGTPS